jgi:hypothetical protein
MSFELARKIADAVLYEGYLLYPYRASSAKNRFRWQFGVVAPRAWSESTGGDPWQMQTECLVEARGSATVDITVRFLQVQPRSIEGAAPWDEGVERSIELGSLSLDVLEGAGQDTPFEIGPISGVVRIAAERLGPYVKLRIVIENRSEFPEASSAQRSQAMRLSMAGAHTLLSVRDGSFVSLTDPPSEAAEAAAGCRNLHTWPVLVGEEGARDVMLSSPIILPDYPAIAPESRGDLFDSTEIDEILTLRVMTLTDEEKAEARATDERAREVIDRCDTIPPEIFERLHGAIRSLSPAKTEAFFNPPGEEPERASVEIGNRSVSKGERVRIAPRRRSDSMDLFLAGRIAIVQAVHHDVDDRVYVAVAVEDDPAGEIPGPYQRFFFFGPDELELIERKET